MAETRFTWTYGASERKTIFIDDNTLRDPKGNGIGAITCHRIGNKEAERLANLFVAAPDLLEACEAAKTLIEDMARFVGVMALKNYALFNEAPIALNRAITKARGESEAQDG